MAAAVVPSTVSPGNAEPPPSEPVLRALLFTSDHPSQEVDAGDLARYAELPDNQLLWIDAVVPDGAPEHLSGTGVDPRLLDPEAGGPLGLVLTPKWKYLYVRALNWHAGRKPADIPLAVAIGPNVVVTVHRAPVDFVAKVLDNEADHLRVGRLEATSFATALLDRMLTDYLDARDAFESSLDRLELVILRKPRPAHLLQLQALRHAASRLRRQLAAQRDLFDALARPDLDPAQSDSAERHLALLSKRYGKVTESIEAARELVNGSFDLYTSRAAESTNQAMHTLTVVTVVMGLAATIAGVMGMNFDAPLFKAGQRGFAVTVAIIGTMVLGSAAWAIRRTLFSAR